MIQDIDLRTFLNEQYVVIVIIYRRQLFIKFINVALKIIVNSIPEVSILYVL
jgi:hypothetical protein